MLSLLLAALLFVPVIGIIGISEIGEQAIGAEGTVTHVMNTTLWSTTSALGITPFMIIIVGAAIVLLICMTYSVKRSGLVYEQNKD